MSELLHKLLNERGLSYQTHYLHTSWYVGSKLYDALDNLDGTLTVSNLTPDQAIAATLGGGECELEYIETYEYPDGEEDYLCKCSECGRTSWEPAHNLPKFCSGCGRMVKR